MLNLLKRESNMTHTENGAVTYESTGSECLDLFGTIGALHNAEDREILSRFLRAFTESPDLATKMLFYARDIRGGLGERRVFRVVLRWLAYNEPETVRKNLEYIAEYGRYDDLLSLMGTPVEEEMFTLVKRQLTEDLAAMEEGRAVSLLAKWLPSVNASNAETCTAGKRMAKALGYSEAGYRKALSALRARIRILENDLREKNYTFDYAKQPSRAMFQYRKAFLRNDKERYQSYLQDVNSGKAVLHAGNVSPYELVESYLTLPIWHTNKSYMKNISLEEKEILNATWASLPDFGSDEDAIAVVDTSGSMYYNSRPLPAAVALSLGLYFEEHNKGAFRNHFIEFSAHPKFIQIKGETFADRLRYAASFSQVANTDLEAVFDLILKAAVKNRLPQTELPAKLVILSDMEFDACVDGASETNFESAKRKFAAHGYALPQVVFWNVASRHRQQPVQQNEQGVVLVSGVTPRIFSMIAGGKTSPYEFMMEVLTSERYARIAA